MGVDRSGWQALLLSCALLPVCLIHGSIGATRQVLRDRGKGLQEVRGAGAPVRSGPTPGPAGPGDAAAGARPGAAPGICVLTVTTPGGAAGYSAHLRSVDDWSLARGYPRYCLTEQYNFTRDPEGWCAGLRLSDQCRRRTGHYNKIRHARRTLPRCSWLLYLDVDVAITNSSVRLEPLTGHADRIGVHVIAADMGPRVNNGAFMIRNSPAGFQFLDAWDRAPPSHSFDNGPFTMALVNFGFNQTFSCDPQLRRMTDCISGIFDRHGLPYGSRVFGPVWQLGCRGVPGLPSLQFEDSRRATILGHPAACVWRPGDFDMHMAK